MSAISLSQSATSTRWQANFLALLPQIQTHARIRFRRLRRSDQEEACAEAVAVAAVMYEQLARQGTLGQAYPSSLASFAARHVAGDRHVGGHESSRDVMSHQAQRKRGFAVQSLQAPGPAGWRMVALENKRISPADLAAFRLDFQAWLKTRSPLQRRVIRCLIAGDAPSEVARKVGLSRGRVSQLRGAFERSWRQFQAEAFAAPAARGRR